MDKRTGSLNRSMMASHVKVQPAERRWYSNQDDWGYKVIGDEVWAEPSARRRSRRHQQSHHHHYHHQQQQQSSSWVGSVEHRRATGTSTGGPPARCKYDPVSTHIERRCAPSWCGPIASLSNPASSSWPGRPHRRPTVRPGDCWNWCCSPPNVVGFGLMSSGKGIMWGRYLLGRILRLRRPEIWKRKSGVMDYIWTASSTGWDRSRSRSRSRSRGLHRVVPGPSSRRGSWGQCRWGCWTATSCRPDRGPWVTTEGEGGRGNRRLLPATDLSEWVWSLSHGQIK